jgi:hypothetical protein
VITKNGVPSTACARISSARLLAMPGVEAWAADIDMQQ